MGYTLLINIKIIRDSVGYIHPVSIQIQNVIGYIVPKIMHITQNVMEYILPINIIADHKQRVVPPGAASAWTSIKAGVPQGSILRPVLFPIDINDIAVDIHSCISLFAVDRSLYIIVDNPQQVANLLNADLAKSHLWASKLPYLLIPPNMNLMIISRKHNKPLHPPLNMA